MQKIKQLVGRVRVATWSIGGKKEKEEVAHIKNNGYSFAWLSVIVKMPRLTEKELNQTVSAAHFYSHGLQKRH